MKKLAKLAIVIAMLCPSVNSMAEEGTSNTARNLKIGGGIAAVAGGLVWYNQEDEISKCIDAINAPGTTCTNLSKLEDTRNLMIGITALGVGAVIAGFVLDRNNSSGFQFRAINNGVEIERKGLSLSALNTGQLKLQKTWTF